MLVKHLRVVDKLSPVNGGVIALVGPTGAAIATTLSTSYTKIPEMTLHAVGYGAGSADFPEKANVLRLLIGERESAAAAENVHGESDAPITVIETNVDDMSPTSSNAPLPPAPSTSFPPRYK